MVLVLDRKINWIRGIIMESRNEIGARSNNRKYSKISSLYRIIRTWKIGLITRMLWIFMLVRTSMNIIKNPGICFIRKCEDSRRKIR